jgi:hypothetical protein
LVAKHNDEYNLGSEYVRRAVCRFEERPRGLVGLTQLWGTFLREAETYIAMVVRDKWDEHPVKKALYEQAEKLDTEQARKLNARMLAARSEEVNSADPLETE